MVDGFDFTNELPFLSVISILWSNMACTTMNHQICSTNIGTETLPPVYLKVCVSASFISVNLFQYKRWVHDNCWRFTGVYAFDKVTGFWLITSIPKFPPPKSKGYAFNMAAVQDGHMALCLTLNSGSVIDLRMYEC